MALTIVSEICTRSRVVRLVTLRAIARIVCVRDDVIGIVSVTWAGIAVVVVIGIVAVLIAIIAVAQRATRRETGGETYARAITMAPAMTIPVRELPAPDKTTGTCSADISLRISEAAAHCSTAEAAARRASTHPCAHTAVKSSATVEPCAAMEAAMTADSVLLRHHRSRNCQRCRANMLNVFILFISSLHNSPGANIPVNTFQYRRDFTIV